MNLRNLSLSICISALALPGAMANSSPSDFSGLETITFETGGTGLPSIEGVSFLSDSVFGLPQYSHWFGGDATFGHMFRAVQDPAFGQQLFGNLSSGPGYSDLGIRFDTPVQAVGAWLFTFPNAPTPGMVEFIARDFDGNVLNSHQFVLPVAPNAFTPPEFYGFSSEAGANISQVEWRIVGDTVHSGFFGVDNVSFGTIGAVPEPSSIALFGIGLAALIARRKSGERTSLPASANVL